MSLNRKTAPLDSELVRVYNRTERAFLHEITLEDEHKTKVKYKLEAGSFGKVAPEVAEKWLKMFPGQVVTDNEAHESVNAAEKALADKTAELVAAQKRIEDLEAQLQIAKVPRGVKRGTDHI